MSAPDATRVTLEIVETSEGSPDEVLRSLAADLGENEDLGGSVRLLTRPPAPGEQGSAVVAIEVLNAAGPYASALVGGVFGWLAVRTRSRRTRLLVRRRGGDTIEVEAATPGEAARLLRYLEGPAAE